MGSYLKSKEKYKQNYKEQINTHHDTSKSQKYKPAFFVQVVCLK